MNGILPWEGRKRALEKAAGLRVKRCTQGLDTCLRSRIKYIVSKGVKEFERLGHVVRRYVLKVVHGNLSGILASELSDDVLYH